MENKLQRLPYFILTLLAVLYPIWVLPMFNGNVALNKPFLFVLATSLVALIWSIRTVFTKRVWLSFSAINSAILCAAAATLLSALLVPNPLHQLGGRFLITAAAALLLLFGTTLAPKFRWHQALKLLLISGSIASIVSLLQLTPAQPSLLLAKIFPHVFQNGSQFSLTDNHVMLLSLLIPVGLAGLMESGNTLKTLFKKAARPTDLLRSPLPWSLLCLITAGVYLGLSLTRPELNIAFLPYSYGWQIFVENFKSFRNLLFGIGPENFAVVFHRFRDVSFNTLPIWQTRFTASSSELLQVATTSGLLALVAWLSVFAASAVGIKRIKKTSPSLALFVILHFFAFMLMPYNVILYFTLTLGLLTLTNEQQIANHSVVKDVLFLLSAIKVAAPGSLKSVKTQAGFALVCGLLVAALMAAGLFLAGRVYAASIFFELSRQAASNGGVRSMYEHQQNAIRFQPMNPLYRRTYATTNLIIARTLVQKSELSDQDRALFSQLLQQAIRESRNAALLGPNETENWEAMTTVYSNILEVEGANTWAIAAAAQAIQTDPVSPALRLNLANLYFMLNQYDQALRLAEQAVQLKPDWANPYITYGAILERQEQTALAIQAYEKGYSVMPDNTPGKGELAGRIDTLKAKLAVDSAKKPTENSTTQTLPGNSTPTTPTEQPQVNNPPEGFGDLVQGKRPEDSQDDGSTATQQPVVLPSDVGF